jgi:hypothetical protein
MVRVSSSYADRLSPYVHRFRSERSVRLFRGEVALDVEDVVDGGVGGEKSLS